MIEQTGYKDQEDIFLVLVTVRLILGINIIVKARSPKRYNVISLSALFVTFTINTSCNDIFHLSRGESSDMQRQVT